MLSSTLLFIAGPSEPPSLIMSITYMLSDPFPPFQLAAAGEEKRGKEKKGAGQNYGGPTSFSALV